MHHRKRALLAAGFVILCLLAVSIFVVVYLRESPAEVALPEPGAGSRPVLTMPFTNGTAATEGDEVFASVCANYPGVVAGAGRAELVRFHGGSQMNRNGPGGKAAMAGTYGKLAQWCRPGGGLGLWGIYEYWGPGRYVAVYRVRPLDGWDGRESCMVEIQSNAGSSLVASYSPKPGELKAGQWVDVPVGFTLGQRTQIEFRFWAGANGFAVDRIYLFRLS